MTDDLEPILSSIPAVPDAPPIMCQECGSWWQVDPQDADPWRCRTCSRIAVYSVQPSRCPRCDRPSLVVRHGHDVRRGLCVCHWSPEQRRIAAQDKARSNAARERERAQQEVATTRQQVAQQAGRLSADCYASRSRHCVEPRAALPYAFCGSCPRFA